MTAASAMLVGDLLWEGTAHPREAFRLTAELTDHLLRHNMIKGTGSRELEPYFLQQTTTGQITTVPGARLLPVQISGPATILASLLLGRPLDATPESAAQHAAWLDTILADFRVHLHRLSPEWQARVLVLLRSALAWEGDQQPDPTRFYRECLQLAESAREQAPAEAARSTRRTRRWALGMG